MRRFSKIKKKHFILISIIILGAFFRFYGLNWDQGQHLHPDERFLTMVTQAIQWPASLGEYFSTSTSSLNPHNKNFGFFVYGTFPLFLTKFLSGIFNMTNYYTLTLFGRGVSGLLDTLSIVFIFFIGKKVFSYKVGLLAALLYASSVLPIQLSHFYATDTFVNFFILITTFCLICLTYARRYRWAFLGGICFGLSLASKISALAFLSFVFVLFFLLLFKEKFSYMLRVLLVFIFTTAIVFRIAQPYAFSGEHFFDLTINPKFIVNLEQLQNLSQPAGYFPPSVQWNNTTPIVYPLKHILLWGLGLPLGVVSITSVFFATVIILKKIMKRNALEIKSIVFISFTVSIIAIFIYQGIQFAKPVRYFSVIYPFFSILTAYFLSEVFTWLGKKTSRFMQLFTFNFLLLTFIIWPIAFFSIYTRPHSRVQASEWIYQNIPVGFRLGVEHWDDGLPLSLDSKRNNSLYQFEELPMFIQDSDEKWKILAEKLQKIDYLVLSSNRVYGSVPKLPDRYAQTIQFYDDLFAGRLNFIKVAEFTSRPKIFGFEIDDDNADETFTVYDHPKVIILKRK